MFQSDVRKDIGEIAKSFFHKRGIKTPEEWNSYKICMKLYDIRHRRFDLGVPYAVVMSDVLTRKLSGYPWMTNVLSMKWGEKPKSYCGLGSIVPMRLSPLEEFLLCLKTGKQVTAYLGHDVNKISVKHSDFQLKNWNIYHAHLDFDVSQRRYTGGKHSNLIFFQVEGRVIHLIDIKRHPYGAEWFDPDLLEIIYHNWPWLLKPMGEGIKVENIQADEMYELSKCAFTFYALKNGIAVCPSTLGVASSGDSIDAVRNTDYLFEQLEECEASLKKNEPYIRKKYMMQCGNELPDIVTFRLKISEEHDFCLQALEVENLRITLFPITDTFYERE